MAGGEAAEPVPDGGGRWSDPAPAAFARCRAGGLFAGAAAAAAVLPAGGAAGAPLALALAAWAGAVAVLGALARPSARVPPAAGLALDVVAALAGGHLVGWAGLPAGAVLVAAGPAAFHAARGARVSPVPPAAALAVAAAAGLVTGAARGGPGWAPVLAGVAAVAAGAAGAAALGSAWRDARAAADAERGDLDRMREAVVTTVSHELRTPLTIVQGLTSTLVSRWDSLPEPKRLDLVDAIGLNVASLDASILHFVDAGRLARGEWELRPAWTDPAAVVQAVVAKLEPVVAGHEVRVRAEVDRVWADEEALARMVELLVVNACRFSAPASPISVRVAAASGGYRLAVTDRGQGIPARDLAHVFEPLWRGDVQGTGVSRGAGLGLAIVRELAERHGGRAAVTSSPGRGSTFSVWWPAPPGAGAPAGTRPPG